MPGKLNKIPAANIYQHPSEHFTDNKLLSQGSNNDIVLTLGDLHGNTMKLIYCLAAYGIMEISSKDYDTLVTIYKKDYKILTNQDLISFKNILNTTHFNIGPTMQLIGDVLADRGQNDYFTLLVLSTLQEKFIPYKILFSNHDAWFISCYESDSTFRYGQNPGQSLSSENLHLILKDDKPSTHEIAQEHYNVLDVTRAEILEYLKRAYQPKLLALSYTLNADKKEIIIYSHAPIGLHTIKQIAKTMSVSYQSKTAEQLAKTIDDINTAFQKRVKNHTLTVTSPKSKNSTALASTIQTEEFYAWLQSNPELNDKNQKEFSKFSSFAVLLWNRLIEFVDRPTKHPKYGYKLQFVHGHCQTENDPENVMNLDNENIIGKGLNSFTGVLPIWISANARKHLELSAHHRHPLRTQPNRSDSKVPTLPDENSATLRAAKRHNHPTILTAGIAAISLPTDLSQKAASLQQEKDSIFYSVDNSLTSAQATVFFQADVASGLQALQNDISNRHWITNMGGEDIVKAKTKLPKSIANIHAVIENAKIDQNNQTVISSNWLATRDVVINLLDQAIKADHFTRDPQTQLWLKRVYVASQTSVANQNTVISPAISHEKVAEIFHTMKYTPLTGGQTILIEDEKGITHNKKVPRTFEKIYTTLQNAQKDKNGSLVLQPNWGAAQQLILEIAKTSAENRTRFRSDNTQLAIISMVNTLTPDIENILQQLDSIKQAILVTAENKKSPSYRVGFFAKNVKNIDGQNITISWKEKFILSLIDQVDNNLLPAISGAEQINQILATSNNLSFLATNNEDLLSSIKPYATLYHP